MELTMTIAEQEVRYPILLSWRDVEELTNLRKDQIREMVKRGDFPPPLKLSTRIFRFDLDEVNVWLRQQHDGRYLNAG